MRLCLPSTYVGIILHFQFILDRCKGQKCFVENTTSQNMSYILCEKLAVAFGEFTLCTTSYTRSSQNTKNILMAIPDLDGSGTFTTVGNVEKVEKIVMKNCPIREVAEEVAISGGDDNNSSFAQKSHSCRYQVFIIPLEEIKRTIGCHCCLISRILLKRKPAKISFAMNNS